MSTFANLDYIKHHQHVSVPDGVRVFVVGDIHGCKKLLMDALHSVDFDFDKDYLFCVGDLIDRGPNNYDTVKLFNDEPRFFCVMGNHDLFAVAEQLDMWWFNGGAWAFDGHNPIVLDVGNRYIVDTKFQNMLLKLPIVLDFTFAGTVYGMIHGGFPNTGVIGSYLDNDWNKLQPCLERFQDSAIEKLVWDREVIESARDGFDAPDVKNVEYVFHGHSYVPTPKFVNNRIYIDTGGVFNGKLTLAEVHANGLITFTTTDKGDQRVTRQS